MKCLNCGKLFPHNSHKSRKYCNNICKKEFYRNKNNINRKKYDTLENKSYKRASLDRFFSKKQK